ncbi:MAG TPA: hypothetical protein VF244_09075 [Acidimicrobiales bacterium]
MSGWRSAWREMAARDELQALEAELEDAESRILEDLACDPPAVVAAPALPAESTGAAPASPSPVPRGYRSGGVVDRVTEVVDQTLIIPPGQGSARVVGGQALFGVAMTVEQAKTLLDAWVELMKDDADGDEGLPPSPEVVAISEFLFDLLDPLAEKLSEQP